MFGLTNVLCGWQYLEWFRWYSWLISPVLPGLPSGCGVSRVSWWVSFLVLMNMFLFGVSSGVVDLLLWLMIRSKYLIAYGRVTYMSLVSWFCCGSWFTLVSTPVISAYPIIRPLRSLKIKFHGYPFAIPFTWYMTVSGIGIASKLLLVIFFSEWILINLNPPWVFPLGPRHIAALVLAAWLFLGVSSSFNWYWQC